MLLGMAEFIRPWKVFTFAIGLTLLIVGSFYWDTYDWDVGISLIMGLLAYLTAPWALSVVRERRWRLLPAALIAYWLTVDGSYTAYNAWKGHPVSVELRHANFFASTALYAICGLLWSPRMSLRELYDCWRQQLDRE